MRKSAIAVIIVTLSIISTNVYALQCDEVADAAPGVCVYWDCRAEHWLEGEWGDEWHANAVIALIDILYAAYYEATIPYEKWTQFQDSLSTPWCYEAVNVHRELEFLYTMLTFTTLDDPWKLNMALERLNEALEHLSHVWHLKPDGSRGDAWFSLFQRLSQQYSEEMGFDS